MLSITSLFSLLFGFIGLYARIRGQTRLGALIGFVELAGIVMLAVGCVLIG